MTTTRSIRIACGMVLLGLVMGASSDAWGIGHLNYLTFKSAVALPGVVLPPGEYAFDLPDTNGREIVQVRARSGKVFYMGFTNRVARPPGLSPRSLVTFGEASAHEPPPIAVWYAIGESFGQEFLYW